MRLSMRRAALLIALAAAPCTALRVPSSILSRRSAVGTATAAALFNGLPASAVDKQPVVVLGPTVAGPRVCQLSRRAGQTMHRSHTHRPSADKPLVTVARVMSPALPDLKCAHPPTRPPVIYAASASRKDGAKKTSNAKAVVRHGELQAMTSR